MAADHDGRQPLRDGALSRGKGHATTGRATGDGGRETDGAGGQRRRAGHPQRASMADVARLAGVSSQTVSRVSNGHPGVVATTRDQVLAAMRQLAYRPNSAARALKRGEFHTIGIILFTLATIGNSRTVEAIAMEAARRKYATTLMPVAAPTQDAVAGAFSRLEELAVDGIVVIMEVHLLNDAAVTLPPGVHVVVVDSDAGDRYTVVDTDQASGARQATHHLLDLGHHTVWHVAGPQESFAGERRTAAWRSTLEEAGRPVPPPLRGDWSAESGYQAGLALADEPECTAVFVANDQMALGVLRAMHEKGRAVPGEVSVVGFDDLPDSGAFTPPLTTIHQDFGEVGRRCVDAVLRQIGSGPGAARGHGTTLVPTRLVVRASTAPPPTATARRRTPRG